MEEEAAWKVLLHFLFFSSSLARLPLLDPLLPGWDALALLSFLNLSLYIYYIYPPLHTNYAAAAAVAVAVAVLGLIEDRRRLILVSILFSLELSLSLSLSIDFSGFIIMMSLAGDIGYCKIQFNNSWDIDFGISNIWLFCFSFYWNVTLWIVLHLCTKNKNKKCIHCIWNFLRCVLFILLKFQPLHFNSRFFEFPIQRLDFIKINKK